VNKIEIRKMDMSDVPFVYEEEIKIFGKSLGEKTLYNEILHNSLSRYFIACVDDQRAGYVGSWLTEPNAEILNLFVLEPYRGQKIGSLLMKKVIVECLENKIHQITLEVRQSNQYAITMYKDLGFTISHKREKYYSDGEDALLMIKDLR
jgi:ribosomal-protein-alanine N-acetyltransferase